MSGKRILFIPFGGGVDADSAINGTVKTYKEKYPNCTVVGWPYGVKAGFYSSWGKDSPDWSNDQSESPLGKGVNVIEDVIIIVGHGNHHTSEISVKAGSPESAPNLTDPKPRFNYGQIILSVEEVAARLRWMGLRSEHKYIKTTSCCGAGIGDYDPDAGKLTVAHDNFPHAFASSLAKALGTSHPDIRVGGYPGYVDCKVINDKLVSPRIAVNKDDLTVATVMVIKTNDFGFKPKQMMKRALYNRYVEPALGEPGRRVIILPASPRCPNCGVVDGHAENCGMGDQKPERLVSVIWYDGRGRVLHSKRELLQSP